MDREIPASARVGSVNIDFLPQGQIPEILNHWRQRGHHGYMVLMNPHSVMSCHRDPAMQDASAQADLVLPDGVGIVLAAKILGYGKQYRVTGPSLMLHLCDVGRKMRLRHFFYGGREGVADCLAKKLREQFPGLHVAGTYCPPFQPISEDQDDHQIVNQINASHADIVWVGLGAPKQECWMRDHVGRLNATALVGVGAAFDFHSGNIPWAPKWIRSIGCEWAYRLAMEPRRMWRRNLDSPLFLAHVLAQAMGNGARRLLGGVQPVIDSLNQDNDLGTGGGALATSHAFALPRPAPSHAMANVAGAA